MFREFLKQKRKEIIKRWFSEVLKAYPDDAARFMENETNRFANPVGHTFAAEFELMYDALLEDSLSEDLTENLARSVKIKAVQDFTPSQAISFIFLLKGAVRSELADQVSDFSEELTAFESQIDNVALLLFDRYMAEREKLYSIRLNEAQRRVARTLERYQTNAAAEQPDNSRGSQDDEQQ